MNVSSPTPQLFSLPNPIIKYITDTPHVPTAYFKLINSCKYFYFKNEIIVTYFAIAAEKFSYTTSRWKVGPYNIKIKDFQGFTIKLDKFPCKLWVTKKLECITGVDINQLIPKLYRCNAVTLKLRNQKLTFKDFVFLSSAVENLYLNDVEIKHKDGSRVMLEAVMGIPRNLCVLQYSNSINTISAETMGKILKLKNLKNLKCMEVEHLPPSFDIDAFAKFFESHKKAIFKLHFSLHSFENVTENAKKRIDAFIDMLVATTEDLNVEISYPGIDATKQSIIRDKFRMREV